MKRFLFISLLLFPAVAFADPNAGTIKICRYPGIIDMNDHKSITIPAGSQFAQDVPVPGHDSQVGYIIKTTHSATMGPKPACVTTAVVVAQKLLPSAPPLGRNTKLLQQFSNPTTEMQAKIVSGFN